MHFTLFEYVMHKKNDDIFTIDSLLSKGSLMIDFAIIFCR